MLSGYITAIVTPFMDGKIDTDAFIRLIHHQLDGGIHGLIVCGATGEGLSLTGDEQKTLWRLAVKESHRRIPIIAGLLAITTDDTLKQAHIAEDAGVDALMVTPPPYLKPSQRDIIQYVQTIHDQTTKPIVLYHNPGRSVVGMAPETVSSLANLPRVVGLKDAGGDGSVLLDRAPDVPDRFQQLCGDDVLAPSYLAFGASGVMSVTSNLVPRLCVDFYQAFQCRDWPTFTKYRDQLHTLHRALFLESSPGPIKYALSRLGLCGGGLRGPLQGPSTSTKKRVDQIMDMLQLKADL